MLKIAVSYQQHRQRVYNHTNWQDIVQLVAILSTVHNCSLNPVVIPQCFNEPNTTNRVLTAETCFSSAMALNKGASSSAYITVVPTSILITPSFIALNEDNLYPIKCDAKIRGADRAVDKWTLISSTPNFVSTIDKNGVYIARVADQSSRYLEEYIHVTVTFVTSDGRTSKAHGIPIGNGAYPEFKVLPSFANVLPKIPQKFTSKKTKDVDQDTKTQYPELGTLSKPKEEEGVYSVKYTAPNQLTGDEWFIMRVIQKNKAQHAGYFIADLTGSIQSTYDKDNRLTLHVEFCSKKLQFISIVSPFIFATIHILTKGIKL